MFVVVAATFVTVIPWVVSFGLYKFRHQDADKWKEVKKARLHDTVMLIFLVREVKLRLLRMCVLCVCVCDM